MTMENQSFEDASPNKKMMIFHCHVSFPGVYRHFLKPSNIVSHKRTAAWIIKDRLALGSSDEEAPRKSPLPMQAAMIHGLGRR